MEGFELVTDQGDPSAQGNHMICLEKKGFGIAANQNEDVNIFKALSDKDSPVAQKY
jgi:hypothetical protein